MCVGAILLTLRHSAILERSAALNPEGAGNPFFALDMGSILMFTVAIVVAVSGVSMALLDTRSKLAEQIAKHDKDIETLKGILNERLEKLRM
jgi:hypothetical protein